MREVRIKAPEGCASQIVQLARSLGIERLGLSSEFVFGPDAKFDVVSAELSTPDAKRLVDALLAAPFFDPSTYALTTRQLRAIVSKADIASVTKPLVEPSPDIIQDLWQFGHLTLGLCGRVVVGAVLLGYGMVQGKLLLIIAGLLFLPLLPVVLSLGVGIESRQRALFVHGAKAMTALTVLLVLGGAAVGWTQEAPLAFSDFSDPLTSCLLSLCIGTAGALATGDDVGRRELIGLATASQLALVPVWLGIGLTRADLSELRGRLCTFGISLLALVVSSALTYLVLRCHERERRVSASSRQA